MVTDLNKIDSAEELKAVNDKKRDYEVFKEELDTEMHQAADSFVRIGFLLKEARDTGILEGSGYATMSDFAKSEYGLSPDQTSRFIGVYERFGDGEGHLKTEFSEHGQTKLIEMLTLPDSVAESIPAELPREEIRQIKQEVKEEQQVTPIERAIENSDIPEGLSDLEAFVFIYLKNEDNFRKFWKGMQEIQAYDTEALLEMFAPSGIGVLSERLPRRGRILLSFNGTENKPALVDVRQDSRSEIDWNELHATLSYRLYPQDAISDTPEEDYEVSYGPMESGAKLDGGKLSEDKENNKVSQGADLGHIETEESQSGTNFEQDSEQEKQPENIMNLPEEKEEIAPAQMEDSKDVSQDHSEDDSVAAGLDDMSEESLSKYDRVMNAAKTLYEEVDRFMLNIEPGFIPLEIQEQFDRVEEKVATWRNAVIEWRKSKE